MCLNVIYVLFCYFDLSIWMICICDVSDITIPLLPLGSCFVDSYADFLGHLVFGPTVPFCSFYHLNVTVLVLCW
jgi:hypothetical protein